MQAEFPPVHFFLHVPKCAGTTVERHFARHLGDGFLIAPRWAHPLRDVIGNRYPDIDRLALRRVRVASGHSLSRNLGAAFTGRPVREHVLLRDPLSWLISFYNYRWMRYETRRDPVPPPFEEWLRTQRRNPISRFLLTRYFGIGHPRVYALSTRARLALLERAFAGFKFVGAWTRVDEAVARVSAELGLPERPEAENVGRAAKTLRVEDVTEAQRARIAQEHALDALLFERWKDRGADPARNPEAGGAAAEALPAYDGLSYLPSDVESAVRRKLWR
ncbi:MAG: hypothetical protein AAF192_02280 [Pseudomonadota bacterium]